MAVTQITTVLAPPCCEKGANPFDLTTLAAARDELGIEDGSQDDRLRRYIGQASRTIAHHCSRVFQLEAVQDQIFIEADPYPYQVPGGVYPLQLRRWPLARTEAVSFTGDTSANSKAVNDIASTAGLYPGALVFGAGVTPGTRIESVAAKSLLLDRVATATASAVPFNTGIQVIQQLAVGVTNVLTPGGDFTVDAEPGSLIRINSWTGFSQKWEACPTLVQYQAGFEHTPPDLEMACLRLVTMRYKGRGRDPLLMEQGQPGLGPQRWWVPGGALPKEIEDLIDHYRVPVAT